MKEPIRTQTGHGVFSMTNIGNIKRDTNEDVAEHDWLRTVGGRELLLAVVCDGVGGGDVGEFASQKTAKAVIRYIEQSGNDPIPDILDGAIRAANQEVYNYFQGTRGKSGNSTVSIACVDLSDGEHGRLYSASVGDSPIYVVREPKDKNTPREMMRLNIDHNVMMESIVFKGMSESQARYLDNAEALTRAIGVSDAINPDVGMYIHVDGQMVSPQKAEALGRNGMPLDQGDTIYIASDGIFDVSPEDGQWFVPEDKFLTFSEDNDVERATKELMSTATGRGPFDNIALATIFVPSPRRRSVGSVIGGLSPAARYALFGGVGVLLLVMLSALYFAFVSSGALSDAEQTQVAVVETNEAFQATVDQINTVQAYTDTPTPTPTPRPPTATPTPLPTPTRRPANVSADQVGFQSFERNFNPANFTAENAVRERIPFASQERISYASIDGGADVPQPANLYLQPQTRLEVDRVENSSNLLELVFYGDSSNLFMQTGQYAVGGVSVVLNENRNIAFESNGSCLAASYISPQQVAFTCYSGESDEDCRYRLGTENGTLPVGNRIIVDLQQETTTATQTVDGEDDMTVRYYRTIESIVGAGGENPESWSCLQDYIDTDYDTVITEDDVCPDEPGNVRGCPDPDEDTLVGNEDVCPFRYGPAAWLGCPDTDGDDVPDHQDACPEEPGNGEDGCPADIDGDSVPDDIDACPETPGIAPSGCPDSDGDGVTDNQDACPAVPGTVNGCEPRDSVSG